MYLQEIGIITFHRANNYGAALQCFALQYFLQEKYKNVCVIDYRSNTIESQYPDSIIISESLSIIDKLKSLIGGILRIHRQKKRNRSFSKFRNTYLRLTPSVFTSDDLPKNINTLIFGSDQIWAISDEDFWYGKNIDNSICKISYAASAGNKERNVLNYINELNKFKSISVREDSLKLLLNNNGLKSAVSNIDPTFLLSKEIWESALPIKRLISEDYLLVYPLRERDKTVQYAKQIAETRNLKLIEISGVISRFPSTNRRETDGPLEFLSLFKYAKAIVTNSFHGTAFSIIFEKPFWTIRLDDGCDGRVENLLTTLNMKSRLVSISDFPTYKDINYLPIKTRINELVDLSSQFLTQNIPSNI